MKFKPVLWTYYKTKSGQYPIKIRVTQTSNGKTTTKYQDLEVSVSKKQWDEKAGRVKNRVNAQEINIKIIESCNSIEKNFITSEVAEVGKKEDLNWWISEYHKNAKLKHGTYYIKKLNTVKNIVKAYQGYVPLKSLTPKFLSDFEAHLLDSGKHINYVADILIRIKMMLKEAIKSGAMEYHKDPFLHFKIKQIRTERQRLDFMDITKLQNVELNGLEALARDMYIFSFYCGGIRFGDLCRLNKSNYLDKRLVYTIHKTSVNRNIKLNEIALKIFKSYDFCFPTKVNWKDEDNSISSKNAHLNNCLKRACKKAKINEISFHSARNSVADYAIKKKLSPREIQGIFAHKSFGTTEVYMRDFYQEESDEAMDKMFKK